ncbi:hypothetical protein CANCADRAFT_71999 [Tortispora caseinolytica NRRL Y-17796]|uniref:Symplekin/Pta1 N-terminal domain-containing protein n=1 Tax=Tortispora caseinolytica NRRL Y-17796 TaxID=767744 RepID=A0A1E4TIA8_9ASCO|nr:hypothetical protein CANCADRAFT_71999 [Tortispora caseinolytica NRRL Y-17796]
MSDQEETGALTSSVSQSESKQAAADLLRAVKEDPGSALKALQGLVPLLSRADISDKSVVAKTLVDVFACELTRSARTALAVNLLEPLKSLLDDCADDDVRKSVIIVVSQLYPCIFRKVARAPRPDSALWDLMETIKTKVWSLWTDGSDRIKIAAIKLAQRVVMAQSEGLTDPRMDDDHQVNIHTVPSDHPFLRKFQLEAEGSALLDRIVSSLEEPELSSPFGTAVIYTSVCLIRSRPSTANSVLNRLLEFRPHQADLRAASHTENQLQVRFLEKAVKISLNSVLRAATRSTDSRLTSLTPKIQRYLQDFMSRSAKLDSRKRPLDGDFDDPAAKRSRQNIDGGSDSITSLTMPPGPASYSDLFTLIDSNDPLSSFDATSLPLHVAIGMISAGLQHASPDQVQSALGAVFQRFSSLVPLKSAPTDKASGKTGINSEEKRERDEDEDADALPAADADNVINAAKQAELLATDLSEDDRLKIFTDAIDRLIESSSAVDDLNMFVNSNKALNFSGLSNHVAAADWNKNSWVLLLARICSRGLADSAAEEDSQGGSLGEKMREEVRSRLKEYVVADFRNRLDAAIIWMNEEWYGDFIKINPKKKSTGEFADTMPNYAKWASILFENVVLYCDSSDDRFLLRWLSEIPQLSTEMIHSLRTICVDPDRSRLGLRSLKFLIALRPPARDDALDVVEQIYKSDDEMTHNETKELLKQYRPSIVKEESN